MIVLGRIVAPFGVQGWVKIHAFGDDPASWKRMPQLWLSARDDAPASDWKALTLRGLRLHGKGVVAAFDEVPDRNAAEAIDGCYLGAPRSALPQPEQDEYYWADLVGLDVVNEAGEVLGRVGGLLSTGAHDVLQVREDVAGKEVERLIPFVAAYVLEVDLAARRIRVAWERDW